MTAQDTRYLYKTAFSPLFGVFVKITHVHTDVDGEFIFTCMVPFEGEADSRILHRESELERFCL